MELGEIIFHITEFSQSLEVFVQFKHYNRDEDNLNTENLIWDITVSSISSNYTHGIEKFDHSLITWLKITDVNKNVSEYVLNSSNGPYPYTPYVEFDSSPEYEIYTHQSSVEITHSGQMTVTWPSDEISGVHS